MPISTSRRSASPFFVLLLRSLFCATHADTDFGPQVADQHDHAAPLVGDGPHRLVQDACRAAPPTPIPSRSVSTLTACTRTSTGPGALRSPLTSARCSTGSAAVSNTCSVKGPPCTLSTLRLRHLLDDLVVPQAVADQVLDGADLEAVALGEGDQVRHARHGAVVVHDLADDAGRVEAGEAREIDAGLGMAGAHQHAALARDQREDVARRDDVV